MEQDRISDEIMAAYVDGALTRSESEALATREASDPDFRAQAESYRRLRAVIADAYSDDLAEPVPARLLAAARAGSGDSAILAFVRRPPAPARFLRPVMAMAASLAIGIAIGRIGLDHEGTGPMIVADADGPMAAGTLAALLETAPSGIADASGDRAILSYARADGSHCRVFALERAALSGLACREAGGWLIAALEPQQGGEPATGLRPAGSEPLPSAIRGLIAREKVGDPLGAEAEATVLARGWRADVPQ